MRCRAVHINDIWANKRFDGSYHNAESNIYDEVISKHSSHVLSHYCSKIFTSGRNKRVYTTPEFGFPFLSNSDVVMANPFLSCNYSSKKHGYDETATLKEGMILTGRVGSIGEVSYVPRFVESAKAMASDNIIRIVVKPPFSKGVIYSYLASRIGRLAIIKHSTGGVQPFITDSMIGNLPIPDFDVSIQNTIDSLIQESSKLRDEAKEMLDRAESLLKSKAQLRDLRPNDYDYYGQHPHYRDISVFERNIKQIGSTTFNAFNHSERTKNLKRLISCKTISLRDAIENGQTYASTGAPSIEVKPGHGIMLINQKDIFDNIVRGKWISKRGVKLDNLVKYGEILIASDGTLGESELFCRALFCNEDMVGSFISSHFIRMKAKEDITPGYLYTWLNSDYGFRLIRNTQAGTKLCHPINKLLLEIPVPIIEHETMKEIDEIVKNAFTKRHLSNKKELQAISIIESEIEKWNN